MYPHERSLVKQLANHPFEIVGVNSDSDLDELKDVLKEENITWRSFQNNRGEDRSSISDDWAVRGWPTVYVIDQEGVIRYKDVRGADLDKAIEGLLSEMGHSVAIAHEEEEEEEDDEESEESDDTK